MLSLSSHLYRCAAPVRHVADVELRRPQEKLQGQAEERHSQKELHHDEAASRSVVMYHWR